jgi:NTP pyrophosphatase (non-canonical NTP hydrolase)
MKMEQTMALVQEVETINDLTAAAHEMATKKGWWETDRSALEIAALIHSEVSEFVEEARMGRPAIYQINPHEEAEELRLVPVDRSDWDPTRKPEGLAIELADVVIRIADYCGRMGWDLQDAINIKLAFNATRPHRHGGKLA